MNEYLRQALVIIGSGPLAYLVLKLIFKKSIMFTFSFYVILYVLFVSYTSSLAGKLGGYASAWVTPVNFLVGALVFVHINRVLRKPLEKAISQLKSFSEGKINIDAERTDNQNELGVLNNSLVQLSENFRKIIDEINNSAQNMVNASQQISKASEQLSQGANEQAGSIEEVSSTMEEIAANIEQNTENALQTDKVSSEANREIQTVAESSEKASDASKDISEKIAIINDIAFQTNLLALNAAVEAARAGEHGKGFAVVAAEVRKLAERSKVAAEEIVKLTQTSLNLSQDTKEVVSGTIPKIVTTNQLIKEISAAGVEQNNGVNQVNTAIQQLNSITQQNASASEELAANAEELYKRSENLKELVSFFTL